MLNPISFYEELGRKAAQARNQGDQMRAASHADHFRRARGLEQGKARLDAASAYSRAYREARNVSLA